MSWGMFVQAAKTTLCTHGIFFARFCGKISLSAVPGKKPAAKAGAGKTSKVHHYNSEVYIMLNTVLNILLVILIIAAIVLAILYFLGNKLQKRQLEQQQMLDAAAQTVSLLVIDKKKLKLTQAGLPKMVVDQTPKYMRWTKVPVVKAKIGPKIVTLIADARVFECLPVKTEAKVILKMCIRDS